jgi:hypothetical protein
VSDFDRLSMDFVNRRRQRDFVPSFGGPRVVPTSDDEVSVLKAQFSMDIILAIYVAAVFAAAVWLSAHVTLSMFALASMILASSIPAIFLIFGVLQRRCFRRWPLHSTSRFSRFRFLLSYFRSRPIAERIFELLRGLAGFFLFGDLLGDMMEDVLASPPGISSPTRLVFVGMVTSIMGIVVFRSARHSLIVALALLPRVGWLARGISSRS